MIKRKALLVAPTVLLLGSCATWGPTWSELTGNIFSRPTPNDAVSVVVIENIDGSGAFPNGPGQPIKVTPGSHVVQMSAIPLRPGWSGGSPLITKTINVAPCQRLYINAQFDNPLSINWTPFIAYEEAIPGCTVPAPAPAAAPAKK
ncbi:MAG: hypothetical protein JSR18_14450 [Proteobacteria bacterium]|nr:hypothetical protein [Pseudomonadota bacterium]